MCRIVKKSALKILSLMRLFICVLSYQKNEKILDQKQKSLDNDGDKETEIITKKFGKNIKATLKVGAHRYKCCKSKLNNSMYVLN